MLRRTSVEGGQRVEFVVESVAPVSVVGDFNQWDPHQGALVANGDDTLTWATVLTPGRYAFRYLRDGQFFDDPHADEFEPNGYGEFHGVLVIAEPDPAPEPAAAVATAETTEPSASTPKPARKPRAPSTKATTGTATRRAPATPRAPRTKPTAELPADDREIINSFERASARHPYLSGASVRVSVADRVIHLEGTVASSLAKQALWDLAWGLRRIRDVRDDVVICS